jgi:hypothetical protein
LPHRQDASVPVITGSEAATDSSRAELEADVHRAAEMLKKFYGDDAANQAARLEQRLKGSTFAGRVSKAVKS